MNLIGGLLWHESHCGFAGVRRFLLSDVAGCWALSAVFWGEVNTKLHRSGAGAAVGVGMLRDAGDSLT